MRFRISEIQAFIGSLCTDQIFQKTQCQQLFLHVARIRKTFSELFSCTTGVQLLQKNSDLKVLSRNFNNSRIEDIGGVSKACTVHNSASQLYFAKPYQRNRK